MQIGWILLCFASAVSTCPTIDEQASELTVVRGESLRLGCPQLVGQVRWVAWSELSGLMNCNQYTPLETNSTECKLPDTLLEMIRIHLPTSSKLPSRCCSGSELVIFVPLSTTHFACFVESTQCGRQFRVAAQLCDRGDPCRNGGRCRDQNVQSDESVARVDCICARDHFGRFCEDVVDRRLQWTIFVAMSVFVIVECVCGSFVLFREKLLPPSLARRFPRLRRRHTFAIGREHRRAFVDILNYGLRPRGLANPSANSNFAQPAGIPVQTLTARL